MGLGGLEREGPFFFVESSNILAVPSAPEHVNAPQLPLRQRSAALNLPASSPHLPIRRAAILGRAQAMFMGEFFLHEGCWTGNFSTSILEAKARGILDEEQVTLLVRFNAAFNQQARHPGPVAPPAPNLLKTHHAWLKSSEYHQYFRNGGAVAGQRGKGSTLGGPAKVLPPAPFARSAKA